MKKIATGLFWIGFLLQLLILSDKVEAQDPVMADRKTTKVYDLGDLMSVQGRIERPSLVVVTEEMDSQSLLEKLQYEAWQDLEREALRSARSAEDPGR